MGLHIATSFTWIGHLGWGNKVADGSLLLKLQIHLKGYNQNHKKTHFLTYPKRHLAMQDFVLFYFVQFLRYWPSKLLLLPQFNGTDFICGAYILNISNNYNNNNNLDYVSEDICF